MMPTTSFCDRGALTIGSKIGGSGISALVPAGDFECHQRRWPAKIPAGHDEVDVLELAGRPEIRHEIGDGGRRERRPGDLDLPAPLLEGGDPEIVRDDAREGVDELDLLSRRAGDRLDHVDALAKLGCQITDLTLLTDLRLQQSEVLLGPIDVRGETCLHRRQRPPVHADPEQEGQVDDPEQPAEIERRQAELDPLETGAAPAAPLGGEVDPDHFDLSPGRRSASPTATAREGPAAWTSSAYPGSISMRWNGFVSSTGMPQFDER